MTSIFYLGQEGQETVKLEVRKSGGKAGLFFAHHYVQKLSNSRVIWPNIRQEETQAFFFFLLWALI